MRRFAMSAVVLLVAAFGITWTSVSQANATASCTSVSAYSDTTGNIVFIPTIGGDTHADNCQLGLGNDNNAVRFLQDTLNHCYSGKLSEDGIYGSLTQAAVKRAQSAVHITVDGIYGPQTRDHIKWWNGIACVHAVGT
jgi:peptidoglycan hydrolase-like protein with peptidoglycan-binding domain